MTERKLNKILERVRAENPPAVPEGFDTRILELLRREPEPQTNSLVDQLHALFPRLAVGAIALIALCVAGDFLVTAMHLPDLTGGVAQISEQWLLPTAGI